MVNGHQKSALSNSDMESEVELVTNDLYWLGCSKVFTTRWADFTRKECDQ